MAARLLVVEDERSIRVTLRQIFEQEGYQTDEATSVEEAIAKRAGSPYDVLLLLDLSLDGDDGLKVLDHLREKSPDTSAIILTGDSSLENATQALRLGALDYLIKPCLVDDLKAAMTRALERRAVAMEAHQRSERAQTQLIALERATQVEAEAAQRRSWFLAEATAVLASSEELARRAAAAVDNARLYHAEQETRRTAERAVERMTRLQSVTATLAQPFDLPDVAARIVDEVRAALGTQAGAVMRLVEDGSVFEVIHEAGYRGDTAAARQVIHTWRRFPSGGNTPADDAVRTGEPVILGSSADRVVRYPHLTSIESLIGEGASVTLPLVIDGRSVGVMYLSFATPREFDPDDRAFLVAIAHQCSIAVEGARLYEAERRARADAEAALRLREEFLSIAAHELKTPVAAIRLIVQVALQRLDRSGELGPERVVQFLRDIDQQSDRLTRLVKQLLDVSRLETGRLRLERAPAELTALIDEMIVSLGPRDGTERIVVEGKEPVVANVDRLRVEQVVRG